ncbi:MAG: hypothetical protein Hyperionvirus4_108 [Hyperionvirus sp.]|uniref:Uncharacterized protein n=1 Tax=Hyperionvirus sp. TaxID=2487770 RepID=A0A3G5ABA9_9VIRU|nr:MAG: hypothetical protein Hyperionvirus4_108 [Hyperionvirus sp.]
MAATPIESKFIPEKILELVALTPKILLFEKVSGALGIDAKYHAFLRVFLESRDFKISWSDRDNDWQIFVMDSQMSLFVNAVIDCNKEIIKKFGNYTLSLVGPEIRKRFAAHRVELWKTEEETPGSCGIHDSIPIKSIPKFVPEATVECESENFIIFRINCSAHSLLVKYDCDFAHGEAVRKAVRDFSTRDSIDLFLMLDLVQTVLGGEIVNISNR